MLMDKKTKDQLVGGLGGGGGPLVILSILNYIRWPSIWLLNLSLGIIGAILVSLATYIYYKY